MATADGDRAIETLKVGDLVWTKLEHGGKPFAAAITATHERDDQPIYRLALESTRTDGAVRSETLLVTPSHPFYVPAKRDFVQMGKLRQGDLLQSLADGEGEGTSTRVVSARLYKPVGKTFNLTVDVGHTFYVGDLRTWVHNTGPCAPIPTTTIKAAEGVIATRVNVRNGDGSKGSGLEYAWKKHGGGWGDNKSAFSISKEELRAVLQEPVVVKTPAYRSPTTGNYIRTVDMNRVIGVDAKTGGKQTSIMTIITDHKGNLVNAFPGKTF